MKQFFNTICIVTILAGLVFSGNSRVLKSEFKKDRMKRIEPDYRRGTASRDACPHQYPNNINSEVTVIDSSSNGYGMVSTVTRPMDVNSDGNMLVVYRQNIPGQAGTTHGQLGAGYGVVTDGAVQWDKQYNINANGNPPWGGGGVGGEGTAQARYPSAIASEEYPYAIWNEYTGNVAGWPAGCSSYGGRPYFSYDEFGWGGESWLYPAELDPLYDCTKDLWTGSVGYGYDNAADEHHVTIVYDDWTRTGSYQFTSEAVEDGYIVLGTELLAVNPQHLGTDGYSSAATLSMNNNGQGILGIDGIFAGTDMDNDVCSPPASNISPNCNKTPMFKLTDNFGELWYGNHAAFDFYFVPDDVFDAIFSTWPNTDVDACTGEISDIDDFWSWYEFDMRVDGDGNPHIVISIIGESTNYFHFLDGYTGFYHLTIDRDNLASPGAINSATGWNWSYIPLPANDSFEWERPDGYSYLYGAMCQISLSRDNPDVVYMVANIAEKGPMSAEADANGDGIEDDPCNVSDFPWDLYPEWSEDIWVAKSVDNGSTWTALENLTQTPRDPDHPGENNCAPEEQYSHTAHWSDDERVYFQYNQPNWEFNEIGDPLAADCMNRVFIGYSWVEETGVGGCTNENDCNFDPEAAFDNGSCGSGGSYQTEVCADGTGGCIGSPCFGCDCNGDCYDPGTLLPPLIDDCNDVCGGDGIQICASGGGLGLCEGGLTLCQYNTAVKNMNHPDHEDYTPDCDEWADINYWESCDNNEDSATYVCSPNHPAATAGDCTGWEATACAETGDPGVGGGRCSICFDDDAIAGLDCTGWQPSTNNPCEVACSNEASVWSTPTVGYMPGDSNNDNGCDQAVYPCDDYYTSKTDCNAANGFWTPFTDNWDPDCTGECNELYLEEGGDPNECHCLADDSEGYCEVTCPSLGDINGDGGFNVLDIVALANCVLAQNCPDLENACAGDMNGDGGYNVLDIVALANCVLAQNCNGRVDDASESRLIMNGNIVSIEADGFIGGVQMTLKHGDDFSIEMTERALFADYLTSDNETRLLVITPETDVIFNYSGDFEITELIVANSYAEVSVSLPLAASFRLSEAYPNPFNPVTTMELVMPVAGDMTVEVYNLLGQSVSTLTSGYKDAGTYSLIWDATDAASGMYFVKAQANGFTKIQKLMLVK